MSQLPRGLRDSNSATQEKAPGPAARRLLPTGFLLFCLASWPASSLGHACPASSSEACGPDCSRAVSLAIDGDYEAALSVFKKLLYESPEDALLNYYAGAALARLNRLPEAMIHLERSLRFGASFPQAYLELAQVYLKKKLTADARMVTRKGVQRFPGNEALQKLHGQMAQETGH